MLQVLSNTTNDIAVVAKELKQTVQRFNNSEAFWGIVNDKTLPQNLRLSLYRIKDASGLMYHSVAGLKSVIDDISNGKGTVGKLLKDTLLAENIKDGIGKIKTVGAHADTLVNQINAMVVSISNDINNGDGVLHVLLKNKEMAERLQNDIKNIEHGTRRFAELMEAAKSSFLFRGYFKRLEKQKNTPASGY